MSTQKKHRILYVEDDEHLAYVTKDNLEKRGYEITMCHDGLSAIQTFQQNRFDICILDVMLPKVDGFTVAQKIRDKDSHVPILFLTAKSLLEDKIHGFQLGGDDYITKPFSIEELTYKIEVFIKRSLVLNEAVADKNIFTISTFTFDFKELSLKSATTHHSLTLREAELLRMFCLNINQVVKRDDILKQVWGEDDYYIGRSLDVFVSRLRKYFETDPNINIENIRSVGFKLIVNPS
jgi:two-component system, OmpR family, response regulator VicR